MDAVHVTKLKTAISALKTAVQEAVSAGVKAAEKNPIEINGIGPLVKINGLVDKATSRVDEAVERTTPKPKEEKKKGDDKKK